MVLKIPQRHVISVGDTEWVRVNFTDHLDSGEVLSGAPNAAEQTTSTLTITNTALNSATYTEADTGDTVAVNSAVEFKVAGGLTNESPYAVRVTVNTNCSRVFVRDLELSWA